MSASLEGALSPLGSAQIRCVAGIDLAKQVHVVCAVEAPGGTLRQRATRSEATPEGYAQVGCWLQQWRPPAEVLVGLQATGGAGTRSPRG